MAEAPKYIRNPVIPLDEEGRTQYIAIELDKISKFSYETGTSIGDEGGTEPGPGVPPPVPGHYHWHDNLLNVTPDQHHNQVHVLYGTDHSDVNTSVPAEQGGFLVFENGFWESSQTIKLVPRNDNDLDLHYGDYLIDGETTNKWDSFIPNKWYVVGDSLTAPMGGIDGILEFNTDGAGTVQPYIVNSGAGYDGDFWICANDSVNTANALMYATVNGGEITAIEVSSQTGAFGASQSAVNIPGASSADMESWAYLIYNKGGWDAVLDAQNGRSVARTGTSYIYNAPPSLYGDVALIVLGGNDAGGIDLGGGTGPGGAPADITQAEFETALTELITKFQNDGYTVALMLAAYNDLNEFANDPTWIQATDLIRESQIKVAAAMGVTDVWDVPTTNLSDLLHPDQQGHQIMREDMYPRLVARGSTNKGMEWVYPYTFGSEYKANQVVKDGFWTMLANKPTTDRAAPQPIGSPYNLYDPDNTVTQSLLAKSLSYGQRYTPQVNPAYITGYRVHTVLGNFYRVFAILDPAGDNPVITELISFTAAHSGWRDFYTSGTLLDVGETMDLLVHVVEPDPTPTVWTSQWDYDTPPNDAIPLSGQAVHSNKSPESLRIHKTDDNGVDQSTQLDALTVGDIITSGGVSWSIQLITDNTTWIDFTVAPAVQSSPDGVRDFNFETVTPTPISFQVETDKWVGTAGVSGLFEAAGAFYLLDYLENNNQYGVDLYLQDYSVSDDWDLVAVSEVSSLEGEEGEANTASSAGGESLVLPKSGVDLPFKGLQAGTNVTLSAGANTITINASGGGAGYWDPVGNDIINNNSGNVTTGTPLLVNTADPYNSGSPSPFEVFGASRFWRTDQNGVVTVSRKASASVPVTGDTLAQINMGGHAQTGTDNKTGGRIALEAFANWSASTAESKMKFQVTPGNSIAPIDMVSIDGRGVLTVHAGPANPRILLEPWGTGDNDQNIIIDHVEDRFRIFSSPVAGGAAKFGMTLSDSSGWVQFGADTEPGAKFVLTGDSIANGAYDTRWQTIDRGKNAVINSGPGTTQLWEIWSGDGVREAFMGTGGAWVYFHGGPAMGHIFRVGDSVNYMTAYTDGLLAVGQPPPNWVANTSISMILKDSISCLSVPATTSGSNAYWNFSVLSYFSSDRRLKKNIHKLDLGIEQVMKIEPQRFTTKDEGEEKIGFIAQDVQKEIAEASYVPDNAEKDYLALHEHVLLATLWNAVRDLKEELDELKKDNAKGTK